MSEPTERLILHDKTGQPWEITVRPDGQLQSAKYLDGEPMTAIDQFDQMFTDRLEELLTEPIRNLRD